MSVGFNAGTDGSGMELASENDVTEVSAGGDDGGEGIVVRCRVLGRVDLGEELEGVRATI